MQIIIVGVCFIGMILFSIVERLRVGKIMDNLYEMLEAAMDGTFCEKRFDESKMSAVEAKMAQYLASSESSSKRVREEKEKIKTLIADISHQTKTPIANILLYTDLLSELDLGEEEMEYINALYGQTEKLNFLIQSLVKLSRLETGIISLKPKKQEIAPMIEKVIEQYKLKAQRKGLYLHFDNEKLEDRKKIKNITDGEEIKDEEIKNRKDVKDMEKIAIFDEKWTREAIGNIVDNAIKYTKEGGVKIAIRPYEMFVAVEICDSGIGILEEERAKIFQRFYRSFSVGQEDGVGIGLYLAREVIRAEGGYIKVSSKIGEGSKFVVYLSR